MVVGKVNFDKLFNLFFRLLNEYNVIYFSLLLGLNKNI